MAQLALSCHAYPECALALGRCLSQLQELAALKNGIDYLQVFEDPDKSEGLWFMEDDEGGAITALLPADH